jgi:predicted  nucleic acid-binding Zn-ribbon protein
MRGAERLLDLQEIDSTIDRLVIRRRALESGEEVTAAREEANAAEASLGETRLALDALGRDEQRLEHTVSSIEAKIAAEEKRLYDGSVANVKELESLRHEVESLKARRSDREDELLLILEQREGLEARAKEREVVASELREHVDTASKQTASELAGIEEELKRKRADRDAIAPSIDPQMLDLYEDLRPQKKGVGAAALVDGVCQACHEKLSAMELDKLKRTEGVPRCEYCRRILVL